MHLTLSGVFVTVLEGLFLVLFWAWVCSAALFLRNTILPRTPITQHPQRYGLPANTVQFQATDGTPLEGWIIPSPGAGPKGPALRAELPSATALGGGAISGDPDRPWILLCHGLGANREDLLDIASSLHAARFNLFLFDFRGHGGSHGRVTSFGWQEQRDLEGALSFLGRQADVPAKPYGVYGISLGASVALMVAAHDERIGAVVADSPYTTLEESLGRHRTLMYPLPKIPFLWFVLATYRCRFGVWPKAVSPEASVAAISPRPLLLIHGAKDDRMPPQGAMRMFAQASPPKELWMIEGAGHLEGYGLYQADYLKRLVQFFNERVTE